MSWYNLLSGQEALVSLGGVDPLAGLLLVLEDGGLVLPLGQLQPLGVLPLAGFLLQSLQLDLSLSLLQHLRQH